MALSINPSPGHAAVPRGNRATPGGADDFAGLGEPAGTSKGKAAPAAGKPKSKGLMIGLIAGGALLLVTCCCTGVVGGGYWFYRSQANKIAIVGVWRTPFLEYEFRPDGKMKLRNLVNGGQSDLVYTFVERNVIEIKGDTVGDNMLNGAPYPTRRLEVTITGNELLVRQLSPQREPEGIKFKRG